MRRVIDNEGNVVNENMVPKLTKKQLIKVYETMVLVRVLDEKGLKLQRQGRIGFHIPVRGQEAHVGAAAALIDEDWIFPAYREHGLALYRGMKLKELINHLFANSDDKMTKGRRLPGLFGDPNFRFVNASAPIGTQIIHATGTAYALKYKKEKSIAITFFGDGATSSNDFHSGLNFAGVTKVPVIFYCNNNQYAISVPREKQTAAKKLSDKAIGYGIEGIQIDGNDVLAVIYSVQEAANRARNGDGATLIEAITYRIGSHTSSDDPTVYRTEEEVNEWIKKDPIERFQKFLINKGILDKKTVDYTHKKYDSEISKLIKEAEKISKPDLQSMFTDVYQEMPWHLKEQYQEILDIKKEELEG